MAGTSGGKRPGASAKKAPAKRAQKKAVKRATAKKSPARKATPAKSMSRASSAKSAAKASRAKEPAAPVVAARRSIPESTRLMVAAAADACEEKKAEDTRILELDSSDAGFTDFFLITSGTNERQTQSIADEIEMRLKREFGTYPNSVEGKRQGEWVLLDYVDFVVHIFLAEKRAFYDIERLRKSATLVDLKELQASLTSNASRPRASSRRAAAK